MVYHRIPLNGLFNFYEYSFLNPHSLTFFFPWFLLLPSQACGVFHVSKTWRKLVSFIWNDVLHFVFHKSLFQLSGLPRKTEPIGWGSIDLSTDWSVYRLIDRSIYLEIYYKELAYRIMEANKSQDLQWANWRQSWWCEFRSESWQARDPGRADVSVCVWR